MPDQILGWSKAERLLETEEGKEIFENLYQKICEKAGGIFSDMTQKEKSREELLSKPIRILNLMIWNEMTESDMAELLAKANKDLYKNYREKVQQNKN